MQATHSNPVPTHPRHPGFRLISSPSFGWIVLLLSIGVIVLGIGAYFEKPPSPSRPYALLTSICLGTCVVPIVFGCVVLGMPLVGSLFKKTSPRTARKWTYLVLTLHLVSIINVLHTLRLWKKPDPSTFDAVFGLIAAALSVLLFLALVGKVANEVKWFRRTHKSPPTL